MAKRRAPVILLILSLAAGAFAVEFDLTPLSADLSTVFSSIGQDISPRLHQIAMAGNDLVGEATLRGLTRSYITLAGLTLTTTDGVGHALGSSEADLWKFSVISIPGLVKDSLASAGSLASKGFSTGTGWGDTAGTKGAFPLPSIRLGIGFPLPLGFELLANGFYMSMPLIKSGMGFVGQKLPAEVDKINPDFDMLTLGGTIRKTILSDKNGFLRPSLSLGASYTYSRFNMAVQNFTLDSLGMDAIAMEGMGKLAMEGQVGFTAQVHSVGAVLHMSKTILWLLTPYIKMGAYYHISDYSSKFKVNASLAAEKKNTDGTTMKDVDGKIQYETSYSPLGELNAPVSIHSEDVSFIASTGLEVKLLPITVTLGASLDLERPAVEIPTIDFAKLDIEKILPDLDLNGLAFTVAVRLQI